MKTAMTAVSGAHLWKHSMIKDNQKDYNPFLITNSHNGEGLQIQDVLPTYGVEPKRINL